MAKAKADLKELSKKSPGGATWVGTGTIDEIQTGALMRIADATEVMAHRHTELLAEVERLRASNRNLRERCDRLTNSNRGLRGALTRAKRETT